MPFCPVPEALTGMRSRQGCWKQREEGTGPSCQCFATSTGPIQHLWDSINGLIRKHWEAPDNSLSPSKTELHFLWLGKQMSLISPGNSWLHQVCVRITHLADIGSRSISSVGTGSNRCKLLLMNKLIGGMGQWEGTASPSLHAVQLTAWSTHGFLSFTLSFWGITPTGKRSVTV